MPWLGFRSDTGWNRLSLAIMSAGVASLVAAGVLFVLSVTGSVDDGYSGPGTTTVFGNPLDLDGLQGPATPQPTPTAQPSDAPIAHLGIPRFGVEAPVVVLGVDGGGVMESPDGPTDVAWYDFSAQPGFGSNAVFSGHVDYINHGPAVFWHLKDMEMGDIVEVKLADGTTYQYRVIGRDQVSATVTGEELQTIVGRTPKEVVTLITCGGSFNASVGQYDSRVVVRAERVYDDAPAGAAGNS